jgi:hypothetical protein
MRPILAHRRPLAPLWRVSEAAEVASVISRFLAAGAGSGRSG